jgi:hypothetical protein
MDSLLRKLTLTRSSTPPTLMDEPTDSPFPLLNLPHEIIDHILSYLEPLHLLDVGATCRVLHIHAESELLWAQAVLDLRLPRAPPSPEPYKSWKELYCTHYPYWFLPRHKLWYSNRSVNSNEMCGSLILSRYDHRTGNIEAYRLLAKHPDVGTFYRWDYRPNVIIHSFEPDVHLHLDDPVIRINGDSYEPCSRLQQEVQLQRATDARLHGIKSGLILTKAMPEDRQTPNMQLWPPKRIPAQARVRAESSTLFKGREHKPQRYDEICQTAFRLRKWLEFRGLGELLGMRMAEDVMTYSTLPPECYTPTPEKPYQGIWVGDYSGHGCEFLVLVQTTAEELDKDPSNTIELDTSPSQILDEEVQANTPPTASSASRNEPTSEESDPPGCSGRLVAIKLTGDRNIPRGEYTWVAPDIGHKGFIRQAQEQMFAGSRIVRSWGHIAASGFVDDQYIPSQLILMSPDCVAQYWEVSLLFSEVYEWMLIICRILRTSVSIGG